MKKILFVAIIATLLIGCNKKEETKSKELARVEQYSSVVYICTGGYATKYHSTSRCSGFGNCKGDIETISESQAISSGRTPCKKCY